MNRCPITYETIEKGFYSKKGLRQLSPTLKHLNPFPFTAEEQIRLAVEHAEKISIQGVQPKLSVSLSVKEEEFKIVDKGGKFILKPPHNLFKEVPENEDLTMRLAKTIGIEVPFHGLIYTKEGSLSYFIKRFDRTKSGKIHVEDFSQLLGDTRDTKYNSSMEKVVSVLEYCNFPAIEKLKLFRRVIFNFLVGNEDMHLKNFSLITSDNLVKLSPAYDLLNTTVLMKTKEELALPVAGKKSNLKREDFVDYFGVERMGLPKGIIEKEMLNFEKSLNSWFDLIDISFLSDKMKSDYKNLITTRWQRLNY